MLLKDNVYNFAVVGDKTPPAHGGRETERSPRHYQEYVPAGGMYILYDEDGRRPTSG